jgi:hypothetical protein
MTRSRPATDRARRRAVRALAAQAGIPYSVAARRLDGALLPASEGRTVYPIGTDAHRQRLLDQRDRRPFAERLADTRRAADLPRGRARHLAERFPPTRGEPGTGVGPLYAGDGREGALALLYTLAGAETPGRVPSAGELAWAAELAEETAVDTLCAALDRSARLLLDSGSVPAPVGELALTGARDLLDAVLVVGDDGHAPGTRVRFAAGPHTGRTATIVGAVWGISGPPVLYQVHVDAGGRQVADPRTLVVLSACRVPLHPVDYAR